MIQYSLVIPVFNEEETIPELYRRLTDTFAKIPGDYEIIFVNDGSADQSVKILKDLNAKDARVKAVDLSRNFGLQPAYSAGVDHATGEAVLIMDGDLQDPPELIPQLIDKYKEGYDVVYTIKTSRKENILKRFAFASFYRILKMISPIEMPLDAGSFSIMSRRVADIYKSLPEKNRLLSGIRAWAGFKQTGIYFKREARFSGEPRQTFSKLMKMATDGMFAFSTVPIRAATYLGVFISALAFLAILVIIALRLFTHYINAVSGWASLMITVIFFGGLQLIFIGILGEYICRIFDEVKNRPLYLVKETIGLKK